MFICSICFTPVRVILLLALLLCSGCFSAYHQAQVTDGPNITLAFRPLHREIPVQRVFFPTTTTDPGNFECVDNILSMALRYGWAASQEWDWGSSVGVLFDYNRCGMNWVRGDLFLQLPKNSVIDMGVGAEMPGGPYFTVGRNIGPWFAFYGEMRMLPETVVIPGMHFKITGNLSIFAEANVVWHQGRVTGMASTGVVIHGAQKPACKRPGGWRSWFRRSQAGAVVNAVIEILIELIGG